MFNRDMVIEELVYIEMETIRNEFLRMTDEQLMQECDDRDISYLFGEDDDENS